VIGLNHYLLLATILFGIGVYGVFAKRNAIAILMSIELMLNAVNINFVAINKFIEPGNTVGQLFAIFIIVVAAAEVSVGLALIISIYRHKKSVNLSDFNLLKW
jgi:NADH:ubiquinone oxidoreductase subunit K